MKKLTLIALFFVLLTFLGACGKRELPTDQALDDGSYFYRNEGLGFSLILPESFEYYQTQRTSGAGFVDLEIFVPSEDTNAEQSLPGYARPILIRVYSEDTWDNAKGGVKELYTYIDEKGDKVYTILFWEDVPSDWQDLWQGEESEQKIIDSFEAE